MLRIVRIGCAVANTKALLWRLTPSKGGVMASNDRDQLNPNSATAPGGRAQSVHQERKAEREEVEEMQERGTLTPESRKQGTTSHLPESETAYMYRSEDDADEKKSGKENSTKSE
jgi:hypothetical protein